jgi:glycosyltransferase involved in cell wall biosynthesis
MHKQRVFVIIPSFNEATVLGATLESLLPLGYSVIVVDDGSDDDTYSIAKRFPVHYLRHGVNLGQGAALQTGMSYALKNGAEVVVHFDADGQHPPDQIPALIEPVLAGECDVVLGSRFLDRRDSALVPRSKRLLLRMGRLVNGLLSGLWLTDTHNGFRAFSRRAAAEINLLENGFAHATELLDQIRRAGLCYKEIPSTIQYSDYARQKGQRLSNSFNIVIDMVLRKVLK